MWENPQFWIGLAALAFGIGLVGLMYWLEKRPRRDFRPKMFPTTLFLLIGLLIALGAGVHLLMLAGFTIPQQH